MTVWRFGDLVDTDTVVQMSVRRSVFVSLFSHATIGQIKKTSTGFFSLFTSVVENCRKLIVLPFGIPPRFSPHTLLGLFVILLGWFR